MSEIFSINLVSEEEMLVLMLLPIYSEIEGLIDTS